jgi:hypothetical protein
MDTSSQLTQPGSRAVSKAATGRARVAGDGASPQRHPDAPADRWAQRLAVAGRSLTETYTSAIAAGIEPEDLDVVFNRLVETIAQAPARQYLARHRRAPGQGDQPRPVIPDAPGSNLCPDPAAIKTPAEFMDALRNYHLWAGKPSMRRIQDQCGSRFAASTICTALKGSKLPSQDMTDAIIVGCGGRQEHREAFATAWRRLTFSQHDKDKEIPQQATVRTLHSVH